MIKYVDNLVAFLADRWQLVLIFILVGISFDDVMSQVSCQEQIF